MAVKVFNHDDPGFRRWLGEHPNGYVLNCYKTGRVHTVRCNSLRSAGPKEEGPGPPRRRIPAPCLAVYPSDCKMVAVST